MPEEVAKSLKENAVQKLIGLQFLAEYEAYSLPEIDFTELRQRGYDYSYDSLERAVSRDTIVANIVQAKIKHAKNKLTIVFCPTVKNADYVVSEYRACGVSSAYIASTLSSTENNRRLDDFRAGKIEVLVNVEMATEFLSRTHGGEHTSRSKIAFKSFLSRTHGGEPKC